MIIVKIGKISNKDLNERIFKNLISNREEILIGPGIGTDTSVLDFDKDLIVISTDPITGTSKDLGKLAINISCNDISCVCAEPVGVLISVLLPPCASLEELEEIIKDANEECIKNNLQIIGGHTEVTDAVNRIVVTTTVVGRVNKKDLPRKNSINKGDVLLVSKTIGIEGSLIICNEKKDFLSDKLNLEEINNIINYSESLSVINESKIAKKFNVKYLHDVTEGGIYGAIWEVAKANNIKILVNRKSIPLSESTKKLCDIFKLNPYRLISSGSMLIIMDKDDYKEYIKCCENYNIKITKIGMVDAGNGAFILDDNDNILKLDEPGPDELYKIY